MKTRLLNRKFATRFQKRNWMMMAKKREHWMNRWDVYKSYYSIMISSALFFVFNECSTHLSGLFQWEIFFFEHSNHRLCNVNVSVIFPLYDWISRSYSIFVIKNKYKKNWIKIKLNFQQKMSKIILKPFWNRWSLYVCFMPSFALHIFSISFMRYIIPFQI